MLERMADGLVCSRRVSERGVHDWAQRAADPRSAGSVREYVGYEEWTGDGFLRREVARCGVALILAFGDELEVHDGEMGPYPRRLRAFVVGNQSHPSVTGVAGHQLGAVDVFNARDLYRSEACNLHYTSTGRPKEIACQSC